MPVPKVTMERINRLVERVAPTGTLRASLRGAWWAGALRAGLRSRCRVL